MFENRFTNNGGLYRERGGGASGSNAHEDGELCCHPTFVEGSVIKLWKRIRLEAVPLSSTPLS